MRCFSSSSSRKLTTVSSASVTRLAAARPSSPRVEKYGREEEHCQLAALVERVGELAELLAHDVELVVLLGDLEQRRARRPGRSLPWPSSACSPLRAEKSSSPSASSTRRCWSSAVERLARDLLGREDVRSATSLRISWIARRVSASMSRRVCSSSSSRLARRGLERLALVAPRRPCARGRRSRRPARGPPCRRSRYSASSSSASALRAVGGVDRLLDRLLALVERLRDRAGTRACAGATCVTPKASSVQIISPTSGVTRKLAALLGRGAVLRGGQDRGWSETHRASRGRTRSGRRRRRRTRSPRSARSRATGCA